MKLAEARVDLRGYLAAVGQLVYEADVAGHFLHKPHDALRLSPFGDRLRIAAVNAVRDDKSHFMDVTELGPAIFLSSSLSAVIDNALRRKTETIRMTLPGQAGTFVSKSFVDDAWSQPLSDWEVEIEESVDSLTFRMSAALFGTEPLQPWQTRFGNFWLRESGELSRISLTLSVDHLTRIAAFGTLIPNLKHELESDTPAVRRSTAHDLNLADAPLNTLGGILALTRHGLVELRGHEGAFDSLSWCGFRLNSRTTTGLLFWPIRNTACFFSRDQLTPSVSRSRSIRWHSHNGIERWPHRRRRMGSQRRGTDTDRARMVEVTLDHLRPGTRLPYFVGASSRQSAARAKRRSGRRIIHCPMGNADPALF